MHGEHAISTLRLSHRHFQRHIGTGAVVGQQIAAYQGLALGDALGVVYRNRSGVGDGHIQAVHRRVARFIAHHHHKAVAHRIIAGAVVLRFIRLSVGVRHHAGGGVIAGNFQCAFIGGNQHRVGRSGGSHIFTCHSNAGHAVVVAHFDDAAYARTGGLLHRQIAVINDHSRVGGVDAARIGGRGFIAGRIFHGSLGNIIAFCQYRRHIGTVSAACLHHGSEGLHLIAAIGNHNRHHRAGRCIGGAGDGGRVVVAVVRRIHGDLRCSQIRSLRGVHVGGGIAGFVAHGGAEAVGFAVCNPT